MGAVQRCSGAMAAPWPAAERGVSRDGSHDFPGAGRRPQPFSPAVSIRATVPRCPSRRTRASRRHPGYAVDQYRGVRRDLLEHRVSIQLCGGEAYHDHHDVLVHYVGLQLYGVEQYRGVLHDVLTHHGGVWSNVVEAYRGVHHGALGHGVGIQLDGGQ